MKSFKKMSFVLLFPFLILFQLLILSCLSIFFITKQTKVMSLMTLYRSYQKLPKHLFI